MRRQNLNAVDAIADREAAERGDLLIVGVRPATGTRVRTDVLDSITSMIGMVPDAVLHLSVGRAADGVTGSPTTSVRCTSPDPLGPVSFDELATVLDPYVETTSSRKDVPAVCSVGRAPVDSAPGRQPFRFHHRRERRGQETTIRAYGGRLKILSHKMTTTGCGGHCRPGRTVEST